MLKYLFFQNKYLYFSISRFLETLSLQLSISIAHTQGEVELTRDKNFEGTTIV